MGKCCGKPVSQKENDPKRALIKLQCHYQGQVKEARCSPSFADITSTLENLFEELKSVPYKCWLNDQELDVENERFEMLMACTSFRVDAVRLYDVEFDANSPLCQVANNLVQIQHASKCIASGLYVSDYFVLTFGSADVSAESVSLKFAYKDKIELQSNFQFAFGRLQLFKCRLPFAFTETFTTLGFPARVPAAQAILQVLFFSAAKPVLQQEQVAIIHDEKGLWTLSKKLPDGSAGAPLLDDNGNVVGFVVGKKTAVSIELVHQELLALEVTEETVPLQVLIARFKQSNLLRVSPRPHDLMRTDSEFSRVSSLGQEAPAISASKIQNPLAAELVCENSALETSEDKQNIHRQIAESLGMDYHVENFFLEAGHFGAITQSRVYSYHPSHFMISQVGVPDIGEGYSLTRSEQGLYIVFDELCFYWDGEHTRELQRPTGSYINHAAVIHLNGLVVLGGKHTATVERLGLATHVWEELPTLPHIVEQAAAVSSANALYLMGGVIQKTASKDIWTLRDDWVLLSVKLPLGLAGIAVIQGEESLYLLGGYSGRSYNKRVWKFAITGEHEALGNMLTEGVFFGLEFGTAGTEHIGFARSGRVFKFDSAAERCFLVSIGGYDYSEMHQENFLQSSFFK